MKFTDRIKNLFGRKKEKRADSVLYRASLAELENRQDKTLSDKIVQEDKPSVREKVNSIRDEMVQSIIDCIEKNPDEWEAGWNGLASGVPYNGTTKKAYRGLNSLYLGIKGAELGYKDPRWVTFNQAKELGASVMKGEKSLPVLFYEQYDKLTKKEFSKNTVKDMTEEEQKAYIKENVRIVLKYSRVFNAEQCVDFPERNEKEFEMPSSERENQNILIESIIANSAAKLSNDGGNRAYYSPNSDTIHLPPVEAFKTMQDYYATALHEIAHSTGHVSRLNRELKSYTEDKRSYALEELRAEFACIFLQTEQGIKPEGKHFSNHAAYIKDWLELIKDNPSELFKAIRDAEKISDYIADNYMHATISADDAEHSRLSEDEDKSEQNVEAVEENTEKNIQAPIDDKKTVTEVNSVGQSHIKQPDNLGNVYEYPLVDGKADRSRARIKYVNGDIYQGGLLNGGYNGDGVYLWHDGGTYEGSFAGNTIAGKGKYVAAEGDTYEGDFKNGVYDGEGAYTWPDGSVFTGTFKNNRMVSGTFKDENGNVYTSEFVYSRLGGHKLKYVKMELMQTPTPSTLDKLDISDNKTSEEHKEENISGNNAVPFSEEEFKAENFSSKVKVINLDAEQFESLERGQKILDNLNLYDNWKTANSPILQEYLKVKHENPGYVIFQRLGDFYEVFGPDAEKVSQMLNLTLTGRDVGAAERIPMCGVPYHTIDQYAEMLANKGENVIIADGTDIREHKAKIDLTEKRVREHADKLEHKEKVNEKTVGEELANKTTWSKINLPEGAVGNEYGKTVLIKMPQDGEYKYFGLFVPTQYLSRDEKSGKWQLRVGDKFIYRLNNDGRQVELTGIELQDSFAGMLIGKEPKRVEPSKRNIAKLERLEKGIPDELKAISRWAVYFTQEKPGKEKRGKVINSVVDGKWANAKNPAQWVDFDTALKYAKENGYEGLSLLLDRKDGITCVDLDECIKDGKYNGVAQKLTGELKNCYTEKSTSGNGLHIFMKDDVLKNGKYRSSVKTNDGDIEVFDTSHIISMTGDVVGETKELGKCPTATAIYLRNQLGEKPKYTAPSSDRSARSAYKPGTDSEVVERIRKGTRAQEFEAYYSGHGVTGDASLDDYNFAKILGWFTGGDADQCFRIMREASTYRPEKRDAYYEHTIQKAISRITLPTKGGVQKSDTVRGEQQSFVGNEK